MEVWWIRFGGRGSKEKFYGRDPKEEILQKSSKRFLWPSGRVPMGSSSLPMDLLCGISSLTGFPFSKSPMAKLLWKNFSNFNFYSRIVFENFKNSSEEY